MGCFCIFLHKKSTLFNWRTECLNNYISMQRKYKRLSRKERENIEVLYFTAHHSIRDIAKIINRNPSTISRELKRNTVNNEYESQKSFLISMHRYHFKR
ncbi:helix-turn-helix domain-containing protein [Mycoplasma sp. BRA290]|uniref:helix-turn-helix domain-containing protein n=1 Tax=Mycoplasma sp. BRA290 TaxID=3401675 RepID=UPI003AAA86EF